MGFFSKAFKSKDAGTASPKPKSKKKHIQTNGAVPAPPAKPLWDDAWTRKEVEPEEIQELLRGCTNEMKSRGAQQPFVLTRDSIPNSSNSAGYTLLPASFQASLRSQRSTHIYTQLLQHGQRGASSW